MNDEQIVELAKADPTNADWGQGVDPGERKVAHLIDATVGGFAARYYGAWHDLGAVTKDPNATAEDLLKLAGADYPIFRTPILARVKAPVSPGSPLEIVHEVEDPRKVNICRLHPATGIPDILGQASPSYPLWTPRDVFLGFADHIIAAAQPTASTCAVLDGGRRVVMSFELPKDIKVGGMPDEGVRIWVVVITSFDQSTPTISYLTTIRPVCSNTVRAGRAQKFAEYVVRKTKNAELRVQFAREALSLVPDFTAAAEQEWNELLDIEVSNAKFEQIVTGLFGPGEEPAKAAQTVWDAKFAQLVQLFSKADTTANVRNTGYAAVQAVTEYVDWNTKVKVKDGQTEQSAHLWRSISGEKTAEVPKRAITERVLALA
jgi:phage/plasmid-like protein (TIGR03299 family)